MSCAFRRAVFGCRDPAVERVHQRHPQRAVRAVPARGRSGACPCRQASAVPAGHRHEQGGGQVHADGRLHLRLRAGDGRADAAPADPARSRPGHHAGAAAPHLLHRRQHRGGPDARAEDAAAEGSSRRGDGGRGTAACRRVCCWALGWGEWTTAAVCSWVNGAR